MRKTAKLGTAGLAGLVGISLLSWPFISSADQATPDETRIDAPAYLKRDDNAADPEPVDEDDDDDSNDTVSRATRNTGPTQATRDNTRDSTRNADTRDNTRGGDDRSRDHSAGVTNDRSRNDNTRR
jgi:hypothetical protein